MGNKKQNLFKFNWSSTNPVTGFNQTANPTLSGDTTGDCAGTNVIYSNIQNVTNTDNQGFEIQYTGTMTGTIEVYASNSGVNFNLLTFDPAITQPTGSTGGCIGSLNQIPFKYILVKYTNVSGSGTLEIWIQSKDLN